MIGRPRAIPTPTPLARALVPLAVLALAAVVGCGQGKKNDELPAPPLAPPAAAPADAAHRVVSVEDQYRTLWRAAMTRFTDVLGTLYTAELTTRADAAAATMEILPVVSDLEPVIADLGLDRAPLAAFVAEHPDRAIAILDEVIMSMDGVDEMRARSAAFAERMESLPMGDMAAARERIAAAMARVRAVREASEELTPAEWDPAKAMGYLMQAP